MPRRRTGGAWAAVVAPLLAGLAAVASSAAPALGATPAFRPLGEGAWSWFADPRIVHHQGRHQRTYVGWIDTAGNVKVASYDHGSHLRTTALLHPELQLDDHSNPSLHVRPDGRLVVFYSRHSGPTMYYRVSREPEDVTAWEAERTIPTNTPGKNGFTYPNPVRLAAEDDLLYLFWRGGNWQPTFSSSPDDATWAPARTLIVVPGHRPYVKYASDGRDTIHLGFTDGHPRNLETNIYYAAYRAGALHRADGTRIKAMSELPLLPSEADLVYDTSHRTWIHDVAVDGAGRPVMVFAVLVAPDAHEYHYARWTGSAWQEALITPAGGSIDESGKEPQYSGGIALDHENPEVVYLSREVRGVHEVEQWTTADGGSSWSGEAITSASTVKNVRPVSPRGLRSLAEDMSVVWLRGEYDHYLAYRTEITTRLLNGGNVPPMAAFTHAVRRGGAPLAVLFDGAASRDPDGSIAAWEWDFGDGVRATGSTASHTYGAPGTYFPRLTVTDEAGDRDVFVSEVVAE